MKDKKYSIFISSTFKDLEKHRKDIHDAIIKDGHFPIAMENFTATNKAQWEIIKPLIDSCDYYVLIVGFSYGTIDKSGGISYTEKEYDYAISINKPILSFILDDSLNSDKNIRNKRKLNSFKKKVLENNKLAQYCKDEKTISSDVIIALNKEYKSNTQSGWIRAKNYQNLQQKYEDLHFEYNRIINPTDFSDLVDMDEEVVLTGHFSGYKRWHVKTTFKSIFLIISQSVDKCPDEDKLFSILARRLEFNGDIPEFEIAIDNESKMRIRNKLKKYNLITISNYMTTKGKMKYWELTRKGEEYLLSIE